MSNENSEADGKSKGEMFSRDSDPPKISAMMACFFKIALPAIVANSLGFIMVTANSICAGRLDDPSILAAVGLGNVCCLICFVTMFMGLNGAQETLTTQAFGYGNLHLCSIYLNRGFFINLVFYIPLALGPAFFSESLFLLLGQDPQVSKLAQTYIRYCMPGLFFHGQFDLLKRWL